MTTILFWDIDGTLLLTARAGVIALEQAAEEALERPVDLATMLTAGMTDAEICLKVAGGDSARAAHMLRRYGELLPEALPQRKGHVLPNVRENLDALSERDDVVNMLLTGNIAQGAEAKLRHYGLWDYFGAGGAFSVEGSDRASIARAARAMLDGPYDGDRTYVIGDTPHDVSCGKVIGARTLAVATGPGYSLEELQACDPWRALERLPEPPGLAALLTLDG